MKKGKYRKLEWQSNKARIPDGVLAIYQLEGQHGQYQSLASSINQETEAFQHNVVLIDSWLGASLITRKSRSVAAEEWVAERLRYATIILRDCVEINPLKRGGVPVLRGTRFTIAQVLAEISEGRNITELAEDFEIDLEQIKRLFESLAICLDRPAAK